MYITKFGARVGVAADNQIGLGNGIPRRVHRRTFGEVTAEVHDALAFRPGISMTAIEFSSIHLFVA